MKRKASSITARACVTKLMVMQTLNRAYSEQTKGMCSLDGCFDEVTGDPVKREDRSHFAHLVVEEASEAFDEAETDEGRVQAVAETLMALELDFSALRGAVERLDEAAAK